MGAHQSMRAGNSGAAAYSATGLIFPAFYALAFLTNAALPSLGLAPYSATGALALAGVGLVALVIARPVFSVSLLYLFAISLSVFVAGVGIESGGYLVETGVQGEATGAFGRLLWFYLVFVACALVGFNYLYREDRVRGPVVPRMTAEQGSIALGLALGAAVIATGVIAGATEGFALLKGVNRFALRNDSADAGPLFNLFLNNQLFVAVLLGTFCSAPNRMVRWTAIVMIVADVALLVLHGEQFMSVLGVGLAVLVPFIAIEAANGERVVRYLGIGAAIALALGCASVFYAYKGQGLDLSDTVMSRVLLQGQVWYVVDSDAGLFDAPTGGAAAFTRVLSSLASPAAPTFFSDRAVSGLRDVMLAYGTPDVLRAYVHDDVTFTMGQMAVPVYWFGFAGAALFIAFTGVVYGALAAAQIVVTQRGGVVMLWLVTKIVSYAGFGLQQGEYWNLFGLRTLGYVLIALAWWYCVDARAPGFHRRIRG
ncbi:membrane protein [Caballeronia arationis]|uniref:DUF6418 domain-containing protein n=1 Tax=Caballeronia arationis TaxID=1777142 RepID=A0A7Z7N775_9BURK|nr:DUF6418 domain-containing protein [Caballeronia arationis]SAK63961.1 membrane protein [Caballeronia arationis]SOE88708.1 hypothetical protein SAMN05446927_7330 [Caballeronia arationis]